MRNSKFIYIFFVYLFLLLLCAREIYPETYSIFYYNPEGSIRDFAYFKSLVEEYLKRYSQDINFIPIILEKDVVQYIRDPKVILGIMPFRFYKEYGTEYGLKLLLVPVKGGKYEYQKVLVSMEGKARTEKPLVIITGTYMSPEEEKVLEKLFGNKQIKFLKLPRDMDALMALYFSQADYALINQDVIEVFKSINPQYVSNLKVNQNVSKIPFPVLVVFTKKLDSGGNLGNLIKQIEKGFLEMQGDPLGTKILNLLGFDKWELPQNITNLKR